VHRVKARDAEAWRRLVGLYSPLVYAWCRKAGLQPQDAADVLQEVFRAVAAGVGSFRRERPEDTFRGWLRVITRNKVHDHFHRETAQPEAVGGTDIQRRMLEIAADESEPPSQADPLATLVHRALETVRSEFEESTWQAFVLTTIEERPAVEVAQRLGLSPGAVRQAKFRVLRRLRQELGDVD
jgi:RNA polymerase sigma-70 factor (ECF subfamily)